MAETALTRRLSTRTCSAGLLLAAALASGCAETAPAAQDARAVDAPRLFVQACAKCHAEDGSGGLAMATNGPKPIDLRHPEWQRSRTDSEIEAAIRDGRGAMPPFNDVLTPVQIAALARHVRTLRQP